jgi:hypothetical protein
MGKLSGLLLLAVVLASLTGQPVAAGGLTANFDGGLLIVEAAGGSTFIGCVDGAVTVNGLAPDSGVLSCVNVTTLQVNGSSGRDFINLGGVTAAAFPALREITVEAGAGDDQVIASELADNLAGGSGEDVFLDTNPDDAVDGGPGRTLFAETPEPSGPPGMAQLPGDGEIGAAGWPAAPLAPPLNNSFAGVNFDTNAIHNGGFVFIPPDPIMAAGPAHVVSVVNTLIEWRPNGGAAGTIQSLQSFFTSLTPVNATFDPKVIYDQFADRFVVLTLERQDTAAGDPVNSSRILVAVSDDSDPNGTWYFHSINSMINIGGTNHWADYPGFAIDEEAAYITNNMFTFGGSPAFGGVRLWIINKAPFYSGGAASFTVHNPYAVVGSPTTTQPAHIFGTAPAGVGTFMTSYSGLSGGGNEFIQVVRVDNPLTVPTFVQQFVNVGNIDNTGVGTLPDAPQSGTGIAVEVNDRRALHAVWRDDSLWTSTTVLPNAGPDAGETTAHWVQLNTFTLAALTLFDQGDIGAEDVAANTYTSFPSVAVDPCHNMAVGFAASAATIFSGAYYTGRLRTDPAGTVQSTGTLAAGTDWYVRTFGGPRNRWGDYSGSALDPGNESDLWLFNEYAMTRGTIIGSEDGRWATQYGSFALNETGFDFGDLPAAYNITNYRTVPERPDDGARHCIVGGLQLGAIGPDADPDGQESNDATGDGSDEDGVSPVGNWSDGTGEVSVTVNGGPGCLSGWLDYWDGTIFGVDNDFDDAGETIINNLFVTNGTNTNNFPLPANAANSQTFNARFRLTPDLDGDGSCADQTALNYYGSSPGGEVEDYQWSFSPTALTGLEENVETAGRPIWPLAVIMLLLASVSLLWYRTSGSATLLTK